jgi:predicted protein tyrosine phosphatase
MPLRAPLTRVGDFFTLTWEHIRDFFAREGLMKYDISEISSRLAVGAAPVDEGFVQALIANGVTHIVDVTDASDDTSLLTSHPSIKYLYNPTADDGSHKPPEWFARSLAFALPMFAEPHTRLYVHCSSGVNRGPSTAFAILRALGWTDEAAYALLKSKRPPVNVAYRADANAAITALGYERT